MKKILFLIIFSISLLISSLPIHAVVPVMTDTNKEIVLDVYGIAGRSMTATGKELFYCFGEPGGITKYMVMANHFGPNFC